MSDEKEDYVTYSMLKLELKFDKLCNRKDYVNYLMLELDHFQKWYEQDTAGFGGNQNMLRIFENVLTALTMINFDGLDKELKDGINKVKEIMMILRVRGGESNSDNSSQAVCVCYKALSILVNKLK